MAFKELFTINYKGKKILILVDDNHRKTFLEVTEDGKYQYPTYEDYQELYHIYNDFDYSTRFLRKMSFKEKVCYKTGLLLVVVGFYATMSHSSFSISNSDRVVNVNSVAQYERLSRDSDTLSLIYGTYQIEREDVIKVINENANLPDEYKSIAINVMDNLIKLDPNINLRIYYQNMKDVTVRVISYDDMVDLVKQNAAGCYRSIANEICLVDTYASNMSVVAHEFTHAAYNMFDIYNGKNIIIGDGFGYSLDEAMTQRIISDTWGNNGAYQQQQNLLNFFIENAANYGYHAYNEKSILSLVDELKLEYPDVDIDYLVDFIDTFTTTRLSFGESPEIYDVAGFCDELFKITIRNIDKNAIYKSFNDFMNVFGTDINIEFYNKYFDLYNQELIKQGFISDKTFKMINNSDYLCFIDNNFYLGNASLYYDYDGNENLFDDNKAVAFLPINGYIKTKMLQEPALNSKVVFDDTYISSILSDEGFLDKSVLNYINNLSANDKRILIDNIFEFVINHIGNDDLYASFNTFVAFLRTDTSMYKEYYDYLIKYDMAVASKYALDYAEINNIRNITCFVRHNNTIYPCINSYDAGAYTDLIWRDFTGVGSKYTQVLFGNGMAYSYVAADNKYKDIVFNDDVLDYYSVSDSGINKIIQYVADNKIENLWDNGNLALLFADLEINDKVNEYKYSKENKLTLDSNLANYYVKLGLDQNKEFGIILYDGDNKPVYGTCLELVDCIYTMPFTTYIKIGNGTTNSWDYVDWLISKEYIKAIPSLVLEYLAPNINTFVETKTYFENGNAFVDSWQAYLLDNPIKVTVDGTSDYLRKIYLYTDSSRNLRVHFFDGTNALVCQIAEDEFEYGIYFTFFEDCLKSYNISNKDSFTKDEIINIANNYLYDFHINKRETHIK